jgi:hypothetical protein
VRTTACIIHTTILLCQLFDLLSGLFNILFYSSIYFSRNAFSSIFYAYLYICVRTYILCELSSTKKTITPIIHLRIRPSTTSSSFMNPCLFESSFVKNQTSVLLHWSHYMWRFFHLTLNFFLFFLFVIS